MQANCSLLLLLLLLLLLPLPSAAACCCVVSHEVSRGRGHWGVESEREVGGWVGGWVGSIIYGGSKLHVDM